MLYQKACILSLSIFCDEIIFIFVNISIVHEVFNCEDKRAIIGLTTTKHWSTIVTSFYTIIPHQCCQRLKNVTCTNIKMHTFNAEIIFSLK